MRQKRKYILSQRFEVKEISGVQMTLVVFDDLTDSELVAQYWHFMEREDYEYLEMLSGELCARGIKLKNKKPR
jgi:hypothetical protein